MHTDTASYLPEAQSRTRKGPGRATAGSYTALQKAKRIVPAQIERVLTVRKMLCVGAGIFSVIIRVHVQKFGKQLHGRLGADVQRLHQGYSERGKKLPGADVNYAAI